MAADFGKQPGYGRTRWGNETDAWTQPPGSRISYPAPRNVHLGERFSGSWPPRRNFGILVGIRWPAADDGATILREAWGDRPVVRRRRRRVPKRSGVSGCERKPDRAQRSTNGGPDAKRRSTLWRYFVFRKKIAQSRARRPSAK